jgi:hypothetical protein
MKMTGLELVGKTGILLRVIILERMHQRGI